MEVQVRPDVLQEHILRKNLSQKHFAHEAGLSCGYLAQLLSGKRQPSGAVRHKLLTATGLEFDTLFTIHKTERPCGERVTEGSHA